MTPVAPARTPHGEARAEDAGGRLYRLTSIERGFVTIVASAPPLSNAEMRRPLQSRNVTTPISPAMFLHRDPNHAWLLQILR